MSFSYSSYIFSVQFIILVIGFVTVAASSGNLTFSVKVRAQDVNRICSGNSDKNYCLEVLNSDSRVKKADLRSAAGILVQRAYFDVSMTKNKLAWLANFHGVILSQFANAKGNLNDANNIYLQTEAALARVYSCEDLFLYPAPAAEPTDLPKTIKDLDNLWNMIMSALNLLRK